MELLLAQLCPALRSHNFVLFFPRYTDNKRANDRRRRVASHEAGTGGKRTDEARPISWLCRPFASPVKNKRAPGFSINARKMENPLSDHAPFHRYRNHTVTASNRPVKCCWIGFWRRTETIFEQLSWMNFNLRDDTDKDERAGQATSVEAMYADIAYAGAIDASFI